jgi:hypothetical protein
LLRDLFRPATYRAIASGLLKYRRLSPYQAAWFPLRPIFLYIGWRFGKGYWR